MIDGQWLVAHEGPVRLTAFASVLVALGVLERVLPLRRDAGFGARELRNLALVLVDTLVLRLAFPLLAVGAAVWARGRGLGLFNAATWPEPLEIAIGALILDAAIYWQHRLMHKIPLLWRLHRMHHSDLKFDVTTGVRFHPLEIALSMAFKLGLVALLGIAPLAVLIFEVVLSCGSLFTHVDFALPRRIDAALRWLIVTPSMHRVHHSPQRIETDSNFSFNLSVWDRLFRSYRTAPHEPERSMTIGLHQFRAPHEQSLVALLLQPLRSPQAPSKAHDHA